MSNENNEFESNEKPNQLNSEPKKSYTGQQIDAMHEAADSNQTAPIAEGVTPAGEPFMGATAEQAKASATNAFFDQAANKQPEETHTSGNDIPPIPPTRSSGNGGIPPKKPNRNKNFLGYFLTGILGVIVGALIVFLAVGNLNNGNANGVVGNNNSITPTKTTKVSYDNTTDTTKALGKVQSAVVSVLNYQQSDSLNNDPFGSGGESPSNKSSEKQASSGSGVVYKKANGKAYVVTNNHVVSGANKLEVTFSNGKKSTAKLVGTDQWNDLAVLEISDKNVTKVAEFGNSDTLKVGEKAIAIGSPLGTEFSGSVTEGIISGLNRAVPVDVNGDGTNDWEAEVIQTDAAINPGNSGGALVNLEGQVIGINSMKIATSNVEGIGFSIPINSVEPIIQQLEQKGEVERPALGVTLRDVDTIPDAQQHDTLKLPEKVNYGALVQTVSNNSSASKAGLKQYDVIVEMNGKKVNNSMSLRKVLYSSGLKIGDKVDIKYYRDGKLKTTTLTLEKAQTVQQ
ncbi:trypsin-like peptidase domain-containing protein [Listeria sp. PSOL-1]|uniref:S1C family serine protease n=1 Tax=Listeria sp. PSOL-1 TaxID=1844999 RepID=UPI0013D2B94D